ncbi:hypothetical protein PanWU01x14_265730 [Parasponia andersonii]|uniref:Uncharacterized protein n=1 Tax=Parasponia andersonii TaxID=3476 RepID=A0A2P5B740_PARAD|nr:hypothetical protein PanWU01x14_265730 [Parasponia andersonii]
MYHGAYKAPRKVLRTMSTKAPYRRRERHFPRCFLSALVSRYQGAKKAPWKMPFTVPARRLGSQGLLRHLELRRFCGHYERHFKALIKRFEMPFLL